MSILIRRFTIQNNVGLHARPAARFVQLAASLAPNRVFIENLSRQSPRVRAGSLIMVLSISALHNDEVQITVEGEQPDTALQAISRFFETDIHETAPSSDTQDGDRSINENGSGPVGETQ